MTLTLTQRLAALDITDERGGGDTIDTQKTKTDRDPAVIGWAF